MHYPTLQTCRELLFPLIRNHMVAVEPAPWYESERRGIERLESIMILMQRDEYSDLLSKAAYLFCSIIDGHPFSNGNKRVAVTLLTYFLILNNFRISAPSMRALREELKRIFPKLRWENIHAFRHPHEYFFYHLALIIADRTQKGKLNFRQEQEAVVQLLGFIAAKE